MPYSDLREYRQRSQAVDIAGHKIAYWQAGEGADLLLIHGFPSAAWDWHALWPELTKRYRVTAMDLLGYGLSAKPYPHQYRVVEQAQIVAKLVEELGIQQAHILAHDYGSSVSQEILSLFIKGNFSAEVLSICFLNGGIFPELHRPLLTQKLLKGPLGGLIAKLMGKSSLDRSFKRIFGKNTPPKTQEIDTLWSLLQENQGNRVLPPLLHYIDERQQHRQKWLHAMQTTQVPLCFINGSEDPISGLHMADRYASVLPEQTLFKLQCGHYPQLELPAETLAAFCQFAEASR